MTEHSYAVIGGGLAGCECALRLARAGLQVTLFEQKPEFRSPAHVNDGLAELVCSNSLRSDELTSGIGLLKAEMRELGSDFMELADAHRVPAGKALAVDREAFSAAMTQRVRSTPGITLVHRQITSLDQLTPGAYGILEPPADSPTVEADGVDFAVLPCLSCSHSGHRLGQGGGFYDRFLARYQGGAVLLCREKLIREDVPLEPHDCPVPWVLTERGLWEDGTPARLG